VPGRLLALLVAALLSLAAAPARAVTRHDDLASLAIQSAAIVRARRGAAREILPYFIVFEHRVEEVYAGPLHPGDLVEVSYDALLKPKLGWTGRAADAGDPVVSDEVILFLTPAGTGGWTLPADAGPRSPWRLVPMGLRIFGDGLAYRFEQLSPTGPLEPVPQRADPFDVMRDPRAGAQLDRPAMLRALDAAIGRVAHVRATVAAPASPERQRALVEIAGPPEDDDDAPVPVAAFGFWEDRVAAAALDALASSGDVDALLEGVARLRDGVSYSLIGHEALGPQLLGAAAAGGAPLHRRLAAIALLGSYWHALQGDASAAQVAALYDDPQPEVRAASLALRFNDRPPRLAAALLARWPRETDPRVKLALLDAAPRFGVLGPLLAASRPIEPLVWAERRRRVVDVSWRVDSAPDHHLTHLAVTARAAGHVVGRLDLTRDNHVTWAGDHGGGAHVFLAFDPPLARGRYDLEARVDLEDDRGQTLSRTFTLHPLRTGLGAASAPSSPAEPAPGPTAPALSITAPPPAPPFRSCVCSLPNGGRAERMPVALAALLGIGAVVRRRRSW
jgi:hypothetical protein